MPPKRKRSRSSSKPSDAIHDLRPSDNIEREPIHDLSKRQPRTGKLLKKFEELTDKQLEAKLATAADMLRDLATQDAMPSER